MFNQCTFIGFLGRDPEIRKTPNGDSVANFSIAVNKKWRSKTGEKQEKTEWVSIVAWGGVADIAERFLKKGSKVMVQGEMETRDWEDKDGNKKYKTEIILRGFSSKLVMLDGFDELDKPSPEKQSQVVVDSDLEDEIPF